MDSAADRLIAQLGLEPHPEGGWYLETWRAPGPGRAASTAIYFLLREGERSHWHAVDADEIWCNHGGDPIVVSMTDGDTVVEVTLGLDLGAGQRPQVVVPAGQWQSATPIGAWGLVSCIVAPGFEFAGFELAPPGWSPVTSTE